MLLFKRIAFHVSAFDRCLGNFHQINHHEVGANAIEVADSPNPKTTSIRPFLFLAQCLTRFPLTTSQFQAWLHLWNPLMLAFALAPMFQAPWVAGTTLSWSRASFDCWLHRNQDWSGQACNGKMWRCFCIHNTYIHTYLPTYLHTYIHTYVRTYIHTYIRTYVRTYIHTYIHTHKHTYIHTYIHACISCIHTYIHTYIHTFLHTYIHTYIRTYILNTLPWSADERISYSSLKLYQHRPQVAWKGINHFRNLLSTGSKYRVIAIFKS